MPRQPASARRPDGDGEPWPRPEPGGGPPGPPPPPAGPPVSNARLGLVVFIGSEVMLFAGLMGAYLVLRYGSPAWPPPGQPRLPRAVTSANTAVLLLSAVTAWRAWRGIRAGDRVRLRRGLAVTALLGAAFLGVQGSEWARLVGHGMSLGSAYGSTFAALIGLHGAHVLGALAWLLVVLWRAGRWKYSARRHLAVELFAVYWIFVSGLWLALFALVYGS